MPDEAIETEVPVDEATDNRDWYGVLAPLGMMSADDRIFDINADVSWRDLPLPLKHMPKDLPGHSESETVASILGLEVYNDMIWGWGTFAKTAMADEAMELFRSGAMRGVSVDLDQAQSSFEDENGNAVDLMALMMGEMEGEPERIIQRLSSLRLAAATTCAIPAFAEAFVRLGSRPDSWDGVPIPGASNSAGPIENPRQQVFKDYPQEERDKMAKDGRAMPDGSYPIADEEDLKNAIQAIGRAKDPEATKAHIKKRAKALGKEDLIPDEWSTQEAITAAAFRMVPLPDPITASAGGTWKPNREWFNSPELNEPTPLTVTAEGRVYGHVATWGVCHIGRGDDCIIAPNSPSNYAYFHTGAILFDDGVLPVGHLTMNTTHPDLSLDAFAAARHYDHTGTVMADVRAGEDRFGIWIAGQLRPGVTDEQVHAFRAAALSGDWRPVAGNLEMVAALSVNVPGFPIPRPALAASGTQTTALVAAAMVTRKMAEQVNEQTMLEQYARQVAEATITAYEKRAEMKKVRARLLEKASPSVEELREKAGR